MMERGREQQRSVECPSHHNRESPEGPVTRTRNAFTNADGLTDCPPQSRDILKNSPVQGRVGQSSSGANEGKVCSQSVELNSPTKLQYACAEILGRVCPSDA